MITNDSFRKILLSSFGATLPNKIAIALSGGVDSLCLTYLLKQYRDHYQPSLEIHAITVDHSYRPSSDIEALKVGALIKKWDINHIITKLSYTQPVHSITNFEEIARDGRYSHFYKICLSHNISSLFLGHNLNDQLETFISRLLRNSSLLGLKGMESKSLIPVKVNFDTPPLYLHRPLLSFQKKDIINTCRENNVSWFEDLSNLDVTLTERNRIRSLIKNMPHDDYNKLCVNYENVVIFSKLIDKCSNEMYADLNKNIKVVDGEVFITFSRSVFSNINQMVLSRFLFKLLYSYSAQKHYHWSYTNIERQLMPKLIEFVNSDSKKIKLTYLRLLFETRKKGEEVTMKIGRQPLNRDESVDIVYRMEKDWGNWVLFDNRYWIRIKGRENRDVKVKLPMVNKKQRSLPLFELEGGRTENGSGDNLRILSENGEVLAQVECRLKPNIYNVT